MSNNHRFGQRQVPIIGQQHQQQAPVIQFNPSSIIVCYTDGVEGHGAFMLPSFWGFLQYISSDDGKVHIVNPFEIREIIAEPIAAQAEGLVA